MMSEMARDLGPICLIAPPFRDPEGDPITVPPKGYGGIQWSLAGVIDGLLSLGLCCVLLGAPGSEPRDGLEVVDAFTREEICGWVAANRPALVSDFANFSGLDSALPPEVRYCTTWQLTGAPPARRNPIYVSYAQRRAAGGGDAPVIRLPANPARYRMVARPHDYLLFLGRVSPWKGTYEAATFAAAAGLDLVIAGPTWDAEYRRRIERDFGARVTFSGEVFGRRRQDLLTHAQALVAMSQPVAGPWGTEWCEPGAAVVAEAAMSGTPVIGSNNGCLAEIVPEVGAVVTDAGSVDAAGTLSGLPARAAVRDRAVELWHHEVIGGQYVRVFERVMAGDSWS
jgi:glycosyltransferase involved in cell wall biosynthesis